MKIKKFNENSYFELIEEISKETYFSLSMKQTNYKLSQIDSLIKKTIDKIIDSFVLSKESDNSEYEISINFELKNSLYFNLTPIEDDYFISRICFNLDREWIYHKIDSIDGLSYFGEYLEKNY